MSKIIRTNRSKDFRPSFLPAEAATALSNWHCRSLKNTRSIQLGWLSARANYDRLKIYAKILRSKKRKFRLETSHSERPTRRYKCEMQMRYFKMEMTPLKMQMGYLKMKMAPLKMKMGYLKMKMTLEKWKWASFFCKSPTAIKIVSKVEWKATYGLRKWYNFWVLFFA